MKENVFLIILSVQVFLFGCQIMTLILRPSYELRNQALLLSGLFICHHLIVFFTFSAENGNMNSLIGFVLSAFLTFWFSRFHFRQINRSFNISDIPIWLRFTLGFLIGGIILLLLLGVYLNKNISVYVSILPFMIVCVWFWLVAGKMNQKCAEKENKSKRERQVPEKWYAVTFGILPCASIFLFLVNNVITYVIITNLCLLAHFCLNIIIQVRSSRSEFRELCQYGHFDKQLAVLSLKLSEMEYKVAVLLLKGLNFEQVADKLNIEVKGCRKHGTVIYRKLECKGKLREFRSRFGYLKVVIEQQERINLV